MTKELLLQRHPVVAVEMSEVRVAVYLEPVLRRARTQIAVEIAARMQAHAAPIAGRKQRRFDLTERHHTGTIVVVDQRTPRHLAAGVGGILGELLRRQGLRPRHRLAGDAAAETSLADAVLHAQHLA